MTAKKKASKRKNKKGARAKEADPAELADARRLPFGELETGDRFAKPGGAVMVKHDISTAVCELHGVTENYAPETVVEALRK